MTDKLPVKEHLRNAALYGPATESLPGDEWKHRLFRQYNMSRQINNTLYARTGIFKWLVYVGVPVVCVLLAFAAYFSFMPPGDWFENISSIKDWNIPPISLKEILLFAAAVNGLTFLIRKREWLL
jgi:hypothetical protein